MQKEQCKKNNAKRTMQKEKQYKLMMMN